MPNFKRFIIPYLLPYPIHPCKITRNWDCIPILLEVVQVISVAYIFKDESYHISLLTGNNY